MVHILRLYSNTQNLIKIHFEDEINTRPKDERIVSNEK